jgi:Glyoxalase-like domain
MAPGNPDHVVGSGQVVLAGCAARAASAAAAAMARWRMSVTYLLARFWAAALGYALEPPPTGFVSWDDYRRDLGAPKADLATGADRIIDPDGGGPRIWFQVVPERKTVKNRLHLDVHVSGGRAVPIQTRRQRVDAEPRRLADLGTTMVGVLSEEGIDHYGVAMNDPEGNEFDIN